MCGYRKSEEREESRGSLISLVIGYCFSSVNEKSRQRYGWSLRFLCEYRKSVGQCDLSVLLVGMRYDFHLTVTTRETWMITSVSKIT